MFTAWRPGRFLTAVGVAAASLGTVAALHYHQRGLTLSHYDSRGHLVVARRVIDSLPPGWQQIGAVWLPLPHLLNLLPVQIDAFFRTGASAVAISIASVAIATGSIASIVLTLTESSAAALGEEVVDSTIAAIAPVAIANDAIEMTTADAPVRYRTSN